MAGSWMGVWWDWKSTLKGNAAQVGSQQYSNMAAALPGGQVREDSP